MARVESEDVTWRERRSPLPHVLFDEICMTLMMLPRKNTITLNDSWLSLFVLSWPFSWPLCLDATGPFRLFFAPNHSELSHPTVSLNNLHVLCYRWTSPQRIHR